MNKVYPFIIFILCCCINTSVRAQHDFRPGYLISLSGDTLRGYLDFQSDINNSQKCSFKKEINGNKTDYAPNEIKSYRFTDGKFYISASLFHIKTHKPAFVEYILNGSISLYYYKDDEFFEHFYVSKDTQILELNHTAKLTAAQLTNAANQASPDKYKGQLKYIMQDQPGMYADIDKCPCTIKNLLALVKKYHKLGCPTEQCIRYEKKTAKNIVMKYGFHISGGISHLSSPPYNLNIGNYDFTNNLDFKTTASAELGFLADMQLNFMGENKCHFECSPAINYVKYDSYIERYLNPLLYTFKVDASFVSLKIPVLFKYSFYSSNRKCNPFFKIGPGSTIYLNAKGNYKYCSGLLNAPPSQIDVSIVDINSLEKLIRYRAYLVAGGGFDIALGKKSMTIALKYEYGYGQYKGFRTDAQIQVGFCL